ncbi:SHOCT domain-containing protein [Pseudalkalibacillus caeni]|uniref:SHOCT domain-containing protein n=1 Tax=Exobacillus caeni TaxID=2574798 RepID=A0A5R9F578_9BACL|nr:SHOCT domain-containing protein [Pseudalkalibacillus caeni]TLS38892.1 hypothetical protein FCL54_00850 [Pseudalkalibacillus caeni]
MMNGGNMMGGGFGMFGWFIPVIIIAIILFLVVYFVRNIQNKNQSSTSSNARAILEERYVKGEISEEEYHRKLNNLQK